MASRVIFDPSSCFPHSLLPGRASSTKVPQTRRISDYLEAITIEGKGFGTVATQDVEAGTFLRRESPAATIWGKILDRPQTMELVSEAYQRMIPEIRARFGELHEGTRSFETREMRIWKSNCFGWVQHSRMAAVSALSSLIWHESTTHACQTRSTTKTTGIIEWSCT
jgi:hypothetical protein